MRVITATAVAAASLGVLGLSAPTALAANPLKGNTLGASTSGRCAAMTNNKIAGTLLGADGYAVNATIGIDLEDSHGRQVDARTGCAASGYGALLQLNHYIGADGAPLGTMQVAAPGRFSPARNVGLVDPTFAVTNLPANVSKVFIETYTRRYTGSPCGLVCAGVTDNSKYGNVNRMFLTPGRATANLKLVADETPAFGGITGSIEFYIHNTSIAHLHVWSMSIKGNLKDEGWGTGVQNTVNRHLWTVTGLSPNQDYTMIASGMPQTYHIKVTKRHLTKVTEKF
jgi:hypothetical protein